MKDRAERFAEVEQRVRSLAAENRTLQVRVRELEQELARARQTSQGFEAYQEKHQQIRQKVEHILASLENAEAKE